MGCGSLKIKRSEKGLSMLFQSLLSDNLNWRAELVGLPFTSISSEEARGLELPFRE